MANDPNRDVLPVKEENNDRITKGRIKIKPCEILAFDRGQCSMLIM